MERPWFVESLLAASGTVDSPGDIPLIRARTLSITARMTFGGSIDEDATVYLYYSPDGNNWDTIAYTSFAVTYTVSSTIQRTAIIDVPEHGYMKIAITNGSQADTITAVETWYTIQSWPIEPGHSKGDISTASLKD